MGCWGIAGPFKLPNGQYGGYGKTSEELGIKTLEKAIELGITFFDTADVYGTGRSERLLGKVLPEYRDDVVIATKFGTTFDQKNNQITGGNGEAEYIRQAVEGSLERLNTDFIDLYQFHVGEYPIDKARETRDELEKLVDEGIIRKFGWSTDYVERAEFFAQSPHCVSVQYRWNITLYNTVMLEMAKLNNLASIIKSPLGGGLLTGKYTTETKRDETHMFSRLDLRSDRISSLLEDIDRFKNIVAEEGLTPAQGALAYLLSIDGTLIPIPGAKTPDQITENAYVLEYGSLPSKIKNEIDSIFSERSRDYNKVIREEV